MTLMTCGKKVCAFLKIDPESIQEIAFVERKLFGVDRLRVRGCVLKTKRQYIIVPDLRDAERIYVYDTLKKLPIIKDLQFRGLSQYEIAALLRCSQSTVSRLLNER